MQAASNRSGLLRAVVKDNNDRDVSSTLDSDGNYNNESRWAADSTHNVSDGLWHMVTLTTRTDTKHGYLLYMDGQIAGMCSRIV